MRLQAALIYDRIAGPASDGEKERYHHETGRAIANVGCQKMNSRKTLHAAMRILEHALTLLIKSSHPLNAQIAYTCHHLTQTIERALQDATQISKKVPFETLLRVQKNLLDALKKGSVKINDKDGMNQYSSEDQEEITLSYSYMVITFLQLTSLACSMLQEATQSQEEKFRKLVKEAVDLKLKAGFDQTLVELASSETTSLLQCDTESSLAVRFPCAATVSLLRSLGSE